jgi:hypothetical protein
MVDRYVILVGVYRNMTDVDEQDIAHKHLTPQDLKILNTLR